MSPLGIKRGVAILLVVSPWLFIPGPIKEFLFVISGILLYISTLDLRKKQIVHEEKRSENESKPLPHHIVS